MKKGTRLYINITNHCNTDCPFCCMYSGRDKNSFMDFDTFKGIIDECDGEFELQLEGGEPLTHKALFLFMEYAVSTGRCKKILILSNGILMKKFLKRIVEFANWNRILVELKLSINYWLIEQVDSFLEDMNQISFATEDLEFVNVVFNVRKRKDVDEGIDELGRADNPSAHRPALQHQPLLHRLLPWHDTLEDEPEGDLCRRTALRPATHRTGAQCFPRTSLPPLRHRHELPPHRQRRPTSPPIQLSAKHLARPRLF